MRRLNIEYWLGKITGNPFLVMIKDMNSKKYARKILILLGAITMHSNEH